MPISLALWWKRNKIMFRRVSGRKARKASFIQMDFQSKYNVKQDLEDVFWKWA